MACAVCQTADVIASCGRCGDAACLQHVPLAGMLCDRCEAEYLARRDRARLRWWFAAPAALVLLGFFLLVDDVRERFGDSAGGLRAITTGSTALDFFLITILVAVVAGGTSVHLRRWWLRRQFVAGSD